MFVEIVRLLIVLFLTAAGSELSAAVSDAELAAFTGVTIGAGVGYVAGGVVGRSLARAMGHVDAMVLPYSIAELVSGAVAAILGGLVGLLVGVPTLVMVPPLWSAGLLALSCWVFAGIGGRIGLRRSRELWHLIGLSPSPLSNARGFGESPASDAHLLDTSAILDGSLLEVSRSGFLRGDLLVPRFVLDELQSIADAQDPVRRRRGRRGLELLEGLHNEPSVNVRILDDEVPEVVEVDAKLVTLGRRLGVRLLTTDRPLAKVAELQGVTCLNLARLADGLRRARIPGEELSVEIVREGSEPGQGVGFLDDGAMVVVTDAAPFVGARVAVKLGHEVNTSRGTMHFATLVTDDDGGVVVVGGATRDAPAAT